MSETLLNSICYGGPVTHKVCEWEYIEPGGRESELRLYYKANANGFIFYSVMWTGGPALDDTPWNPECTYVECLYHGSAYFDGVRHLHMGDEQSNNHGYDYYPTLTDHILILNELRKLELKYCPGVRKN